MGLLDSSIIHVQHAPGPYKRGSKVRVRLGNRLRAELETRQIRVETKGERNF